MVPWLSLVVLSNFVVGCNAYEEFSAFDEDSIQPYPDINTVNATFTEKQTLVSRIDKDQFKQDKNTLEDASQDLCDRGDVLWYKVFGTPRMSRP
jgi:hypothetical protein